jgi:hypothetical protein
LFFSGWAVYFMFADIGFILSHALWYCMGMAAAGVILIPYAAVRDIFTYIPLSIGSFKLLLPPFHGANLARVGVIAFLFRQAAAVFVATMTEMERATEQDAAGPKKIPPLKG